MKILLIEDDHALVDTVQQILSEQNYLVDVALEGQMGLHLAQLFEYDVIVLDLMLPDLDGIKFCTQRRKTGDRTPILVITAQNNNTQKIEVLDAGADDFLLKPLDFEELLARIRVLLRREKSLESVIEWQGIRLDRKKIKLLMIINLLI